MRASTGLYSDRVPLRALANALLSAGNTTGLAQLRQVNVSLSPNQAGAPTFPNVLSSVVPTATLVNFTTMDRKMQNAYSRKASIEVEREIWGKGTLSVDYQYVRGEDLIISVNQNVPTCVASGTNNGCRPDPRFANNSQYSPLASSHYHGLHVAVSDRSASWAHYRLTYTLSQAKANVEEFFFSSPIDPTDLSKDWGRSDDDQRQRLAPVLLSATAQYHVGRHDRPRHGRSFPLAGRGTIEAIAEGFNLTNRRNVVTMNGHFGGGTYPSSPSSTFGQVTTVGDPRAFQFAARLQF